MQGTAKGASRATADVPCIGACRPHGRKAFAKEEQQAQRRPQPPSPVRRRTSTRDSTAVATALWLRVGPVSGRLAAATSAAGADVLRMPTSDVDVDVKASRAIDIDIDDVGIAAQCSVCLPRQACHGWAQCRGPREETPICPSSMRR